MKKNIIILLVTFLLFVNLFGVDAIAEVLKTKGDTQLLRNAQNYQLSRADKLFNGDVVKTFTESYAALSFTEDNSMIKLFPNSSLNIKVKDEKKINILNFGKIWAKVTKGGGQFMIETPNAAASVKGTNFLVNILENGMTQLFTFEGEVLLTDKVSGESMHISAGQMGETTNTGNIVMSEIDFDLIPSNVDAFINEMVSPVTPDEQLEENEIEMQTPQSIPQMKTSTLITPEDVEIEENVEENIVENDSPTDSGPLDFGGGLGSVSINDKFYTQIRLMPELTIGKFGAGLDIELLIDSEGSVREEDWDEWQDYVNKIYYLRYGQRGDVVYGKLGGFPSYTLGHGLIMNNYSNMLKYPEMKQMGLQIGGKLPIAGIETELFTSDVTENDILAGQLSFRPLQKTDIPFVKNIKLGLISAIDNNQNNGLLDTDNDGYYDYFDDFPFDENEHNEVDANASYWEEIYVDINGDSIGFNDWFETSGNLKRNPSIKDFPENDVGAWGLNYELPLLTNKLFSLYHYGEIAEIRKNKDQPFFENSGFIFPGFYAEFLIFKANLELRHFNEGFAPAYFDQLYDEQRATVAGDSIKTKEETLNVTNYPKSKGWFGSITSNIFNIAEFSVIYQDMYADASEGESNKSLSGTLLLKKSFIPKLSSAEITYSQTQFEWEKFEFKAPAAFIEGKINYLLSENSVLVATYQQRYIDLNGDFEIKGEGEIITTTNIGVEFKF